MLYCVWLIIRSSKLSASYDFIDFMNHILLRVLCTMYAYVYYAPYTLARFMHHMLLRVLIRLCKLSTKCISTFKGSPERLTRWRYVFVQHHGHSSSMERTELSVRCMYSRLELCPAVLFRAAYPSLRGIFFVREKQNDPTPPFKPEEKGGYASSTRWSIYKR